MFLYTCAYIDLRKHNTSRAYGGAMDSRLLEIKVSFAEYSLFYGALLQK